MRAKRVRDRERMERFAAEERATRPAGVVTPGAGSDYQRVLRLRERYGQPVARPAAGVDDAEMIDRD